MTVLSPPYGVFCHKEASSCSARRFSSKAGREHPAGCVGSPLYCLQNEVLGEQTRMPINRVFYDTLVSARAYSCDDYEL